MYVVGMSTASCWISSHRAGALGIIGAGGSLGTAMMTPLSAGLISSYQWRNAYLIMDIAPFRTAAVLSLMTVASIPSRLIAGFVADRVKKSKAIIGFALLIAISMLWLSWADQLWKFYLFAVLFGVAYGSIDPPLVALVGDAFGLSKKVGQVMGVLMISWGIGSAAGPYIGGLSFDFTGTYRLAFLSGGLIILLMAICARGLGKPMQFQ